MLTSQERSEKHSRPSPPVGCHVCCWILYRVPSCFGIRLHIAHLHAGMCIDLVLVGCFFHRYMSMMCLNIAGCISVSVSKIHLWI